MTDIKELLQKDDTVQLYSSSDSSESIVETIPCEDMDEQIREWENSSTSSMTSITHIPDDKEKNIKLDTVSKEIGVCPLQGTDCVSGRTVDNAAYIPEIQIARGEEENQVFRIKKVGNSYVLKHNNLKVKIPQLEGASGVSVDEDIILIDNEPIYDIEINNGKVKISKIGDAECEANRSDNNSTNNSGNSETGLYVESQQHQNVEEESDMKKVRGTSQDMQNVLYPPQENRPNPPNHQDTAADVKHTGSFDADVLKQGGKTAFDNPGEQQPSFEEDDKPPIPAPRSKNKENKLENEQDLKSLPTLPPRARRNSQNQPPEIKIQEPMSPKAQQMYKKVTFKVTYSLTGSTERKETEMEKKMRQLDYMKWKFATIDLKSLCANLQFSSRKQQYLFQVNDGILQVDIGSVSDASQIEKHIDYIVDMVIEYSKNCIVRQVFFDSKIRREDVEIAVQELSVMKEGIYYAEINNEEFHVIIICHQSIADQIVEGIRKKISKLEAGSKRHTARIKKPPVFRKKMEKESFKELWLQRFPSVNIRKKYIETNHELLVTLEGPKPEIEEAVAMIEQEYLCNEVSFTHVKYSSQFSNIVDVLCEFTCSLQIDEDISVDINGEKEKIGICSTSSDTNTDEVTNMVKKCIRRKEINKQVNGPDFTSDFVEELKEKLDEKHKPFIHLTFVNEGLIRVYGLIEHMNSCFSNIEKKVHAERKAGSTVHKSSKEQSQPTSSCVKEIIRIENPLVYECICKSEQFRSVAKRGDIQVKQLNSNLNGFEIHVTGLKEAVDSVKYEVKEIEKNIKEYTMDCEVEGNCVLNLFEHIHKLEKSSDIVVKTEKVQIEPISYDSKKIQWIFAQGSTVQIAKSCSLPGKKVLVRFEEESIKTKQGVKMSESDIVVSVPKWVGGSAKEKINLSERLNECLQACLDRSSHHIDVIVGNVSWKMSLFVKQLLLPLKELLQNRMTPCMSVCFCGSDEKICDDIYKACCGFFKGGLSTMPADKRRVTVTIINGNLADTKADILVNSFDRMGNLDRGAISKSLLRKAGKEGHKLQAEIRKFKCPLDSLKIYKTGAYLQGCKFIFHGVLQCHVTDGTSQKKLKRFVLDCLKEAESCNCSSIAFPALGTGNLNYPLYEVKAAMFDAVEEFNMSCSGGTSLQDVKFVLFEPQAFQDFKAEQNKRDSKQPCASSCHTYGNITFKAVNGTIRDIKQDCILYLWESTAFYNAKKRPDQHVLLKEIDEYDRRQLFEKVFPQGRFTNTIVHTFECRKLDYKDVIHAPYEENPSGKQKAVANLLKFAITLKKKSVGLYFDDANPFLRDKKFMTHLAAALSDASSFTTYPIEVVVFVGNNFSNQAISFFKERNQTASGAQTAKPVQPKTENVVITVVGTKSSLDAAVDYLRKQKEVIIIELHMPQVDQVDAIPKPALLNVPGAMFMERGPDHREMQSSSTYVRNPELERIKELECYVEMKNIPMSETKQSLILKLVELELPIIFPKLIYQNGCNTAILICKNVEDAKQLEKISKTEFIFKGYGGRKHNSKVSWNFPKAKDLKKEDKDELKKIHVNVDEATGKIETLTTYQLKCAKAILAKYDKQEVTETQEGINDSELDTIDNIIEMEATEEVWNIVSEICKKDIISFEKKFGPVKFENSKIVIPAHDSDVAKSEVQKLKTSIQEMMKKEIAVIMIDSNKVKKPDVPGFCKEVDESFGYECCVWNPDKNKVYAYDDTCEKVLMVKHKFSITSGLTKPTGQNRRKNRGAVHIQSNDDTALGGITSDNRFVN